jgi:hypothetical protein
MKKLTVKTNLLGRSETFKILAIGHATGYPVLLVGPPGVGKTRVLLDYSMGLHNNNALDALENTFILETDEGTRPAEIKGRVDMEKLLAPGVDAAGKPLTPKYELNSPIAKAKMILINEVDKANPGLRNSMLGVMNEKMLFNGQDKLYCPWELFCASCNLIPKEEADNPFWDRFVIKHHVNRLTKTQMMQYYNKNSKAPVEINLPDQQDINNFIATSLPADVLRAFLDVAYNQLSDRSLSYIPRLIAAVSFVFEVPAKKAAIKTCEILVSPEVAKQLGQKLEPAEISNIRNKIEYISSLQNYDQIINQIEDIKKAAAAASLLPAVTKSDMEDLAKDLNKILAKHPVYNAGISPNTQSVEQESVASGF